jgi:hypothetical protein
MKTIIVAIFPIVLILVFGCGQGTNSGDDYGDLLLSPLGLVLTPHEHRGGWGRSDCFACHPLENIHLQNRSSVAVDLMAIRDLTVIQGEASCPTCHGTNGTSPSDANICSSCH